MEITKRKYITTITYDKICNGVKKSCRESFFDKKYVDIRVNEINNCEYDKEYKINQDTLFLDFIDIYLKKVSMKIDPYKKYEFYVSLTRRYIMDYFEDIYIKDITQTFIENLSTQVNNQVSKYGNKGKVNLYIICPNAPQVKPKRALISAFAVDFRRFGALDLFDLLFVFGPRAHHLAPAARAAELEVRADAQHLPPARAAGVIFFQYKNVSDTDIHTYFPPNWEISPQGVIQCIHSSSRRGFRPGMR